MVELALIFIVDLAMLLLGGAAVVLWLPVAWRRSLMPAAPALGAVFWVVGLLFTGIGLGAQTGVYLVGALAVLLIVIRILRGSWIPGRSELLWLALACVLGLIPFALAFDPAHRVGATVLQPSWSNDAYDYVSLSAWLQAHPITQPPPAHVLPPATGVVSYLLRVGLRVGQESYGAALASIVHLDPYKTWYTTTSTWLLLLPGSVMAMGNVLRVPRAVTIAMGCVVALSANVTFEVFNENTDAVLGIAIAPLTVALTAAVIDGWSRPADLALKPAGDEPASQSSPPIWVAALTVTALVGTYTEYLPLLVPALGLFVLLRHPRRWPRAMLAAVAVLALSVAFGPLAWYRAITSFRTTGGLAGNALPSAYIGDAQLAIARALGAATLTGPSAVPEVVVAILLAAAVVGTLLAFIVSSARRLLFCVVLCTTLIVVALSTSIHYFPYGQMRAIDIGLPFVYVAAVIGLGTLLWKVLRHRRTRALAFILVPLLLVPSVLFVGTNLVTTRMNEHFDISQRYVGTDFAQMVAWAHRVGTSSGSNITVILPDHFSLMWTMYLLRDRPKIDYPFLYGDYTNDATLQFANGHLSRYAIVGTNTIYNIDPADVMARNSRFLMLDLSRGPAVIATGALNTSDPEEDPGGTLQWMFTDPTIIVAHTPQVRSTTLQLMLNPRIAREPLTAHVRGLPPQSQVITPSSLSFTISLRKQGLDVVRIHTAVRGRPPNPRDDRELTVGMLSATR